MSRTKVLLAILLLALLALGCVMYAKHTADAEAKKNADAGERERRTTVVSVVGAPLPTGVPLKGREGNDANGYPTQYVDRPALRSLLSNRRFDDLTRAVEQFQTAFEADPTREYWPIDAGDAFASAETELLPLLTAWVTAKPDSFAPYLARGTYWAAVAQARRGAAWAKDTPPESFSAMDDAIPPASAALAKALSLRPKLVAAMRVQIQLLRKHDATGPMTTGVIDEALRVCPSCFQVRVTYVYALTPRWGGSYAAMLDFARKATADPSRPLMRLLAGYVDLDKADGLRTSKAYDDAMVAINSACALGEHWEFLAARARVERDKGDKVQAKADLDRALLLRPGYPELLFDRAWVSAYLQKWEDAGHDLLDGLRTQPTNDLGRQVFDTVVNGLIYDGWAAFEAGRRDDALRVFDLAKQLAPTNAEVSRRLTWIITEGGTASDTDALEDAIKKAPDDFRAHQQLDYALAKVGKFDRVVAMWNEYLARHPSEGAAYLERGGAYYHLKKLREAQSDCAKACELGISEGCARAKQLAPATQ